MFAYVLSKPQSTILDPISDVSNPADSLHVASESVGFGGEENTGPAW